MSVDNDDFENIYFDSDWQCCYRKIHNSINDTINDPLSFISEYNQQWLPVTLPHIVKNKIQTDSNTGSSYNWWYQKQFNWLCSDQPSEHQVYLIFKSFDDENELNTSNITATIWVNGTQILSNSLLSQQQKIQLPRNLIHSNKNTLVVSCANTNLFLHAQLIVYGKVICKTGKMKIHDNNTEDNNDLNDEKKTSTLSYTVRVNDTDGRIAVGFKNWKQKSKSLLCSSPCSSKNRSIEPAIDEKQTQKSNEALKDIPVPHLTIVILIVGTRGDVQPFIALGQSLLAAGHRVRLATHEPFRSFVRGNGLEFYPLAGDPADLMSFMVKNAGIIPSMSSIVAGDVGKNRRILADILASTWLACTDRDDETLLPFIAEAIIANPPSFGHVHCAEKLQIPLHIMFTMPWSPTTAFPHPLCSIDNAKESKEKINLYSYHVVELLTWSGMHTIVNNFRKRILGLPTIHAHQATNVLIDERVPHTYCWSTALAPKPSDWGSHINVSGFFFLDLGTTYTNPPQDLLDFLGVSNDHHGTKKFPPPIYIGFGSITGHDSRRLLEIVVDAIGKTGYRALLSGLATDTDSLPDNICKIGNVPHDWLFQHVSAVCHHGGAGTTAAGLRAGKPTIIVPFFGDQFFWGNIIEKSGAGPRPLPGKSITADSLAEAFRFAHEPETRVAAEKIRLAMSEENGCESAVRAFHAHLPLDRMRSDLDSTYAACYRVDGFGIQVSRPVAHVLIGAGLINITQLRSHHARKWQRNHDQHGHALTHTVSEQVKKSPSNFTVEKDRNLRQTVSNSTENLATNKHDHEENIAENLYQDINYRETDVLSSYGKKIDEFDYVPPLYDPYSEPDTHLESHISDSDSRIKTTKRSLWHNRKLALMGFLNRSHPAHEDHGMNTGTARALIATTNSVIEPAVGAFPSTTWLGQPTFDVIKETVLKCKTHETQSQSETSPSTASSLTTYDGQNKKLSAAIIAKTISGLPLETCQRILFEFDRIKPERKQTTISSSSPKKHSKQKFQFRRQRSHSTSTID